MLTKRGSMSQAMRYDKVIKGEGEFDIIFGQVRIHCRQVHSDLPCPMSLAMLLRFCESVYPRLRMWLLVLDESYRRPAARARSVLLVLESRVLGTLFIL